MIKMTIQEIEKVLIENKIWEKYPKAVVARFNSYGTLGLFRNKDISYDSNGLFNGGSFITNHTYISCFEENVFDMNLIGDYRTVEILRPELKDISTNSCVMYGNKKLKMKQDIWDNDD